MDKAGTKSKKAQKVVGKALIYSDKRSMSQANGTNGDVIVVHPPGMMFSGFELAHFDIAEITKECFSDDQLVALTEGRPVIHPFNTPHQRVSAVTVKAEAIKKNLVTFDDLTPK